VTTSDRNILNRLIRFCIEQKLIVLVVTVLVIGWGIAVAPFNWDIDWLPSEPVPVDAIPNYGENQQIVFTEWRGRSPQDIDDQVSYPLTVSLLGIPGVKSIRSYSIFGFSSIYVIFEDDIEFYWSRSRILEKLNSLPAGTLPEGVTPALGPDATALGQVFWYTLEGRDPQGNPTGGWDLHELRSIQDWVVRYALMSADGVAEVASVGGFVQEYQIDVDPDAMRAYDVTLDQVFHAVQQSNIDVGARTIEINKAEYVVRGLGFIENLDDVRAIAVASHEQTPVYIRDIAHVSLGPAIRRGALDKAGAEAVGGVVVTRYGANPMQVIDNVKAEIQNIQPGLPEKVLPDGTVSKLTIVPFYDRTGLINETLGTLNHALTLQVLVTIVVVVLMVMHLRSSLLISIMLPLAVLMTFIGMKHFGVDANIVALSGIAIAVGTIVDMGIVLTENVLRRLNEARPDESRLEVVYLASAEVGSAVLTAVLTTIVSFLPVFTLEAAEGKLFRPLAYTKTFALIASIIITLTVLPPLAHMVMARRIRPGIIRQMFGVLLALAGLIFGSFGFAWAGLIVSVFGVYYLVERYFPVLLRRACNWSANLVAVAVVLTVLTNVWEPLGPELGFARNGAFIVAIVGGLLLIFWLFRLVYPWLLGLALRYKTAAMIGPAVLLLLGATIWLGFERMWGWLPESVRSDEQVVAVAHEFPGLGREFMPALDEGAFLYMPTTMPHASIGEAMDVLQKLDMAIAAVPEVDDVVGKIGRVESALDPAPISMVETVVTYHPEYVLDDDGRRQQFRYDEQRDQFIRDEDGRLIPDDDGRPFRQWRDHIQSPDDIWDAIVDAAELPGTTSAPKLQPIETRIIMLQSGFRASMGVKVFGPDLETIESFGIKLEQILRNVPSVNTPTVFAERIVGKPYLEIDIDRERIARYGISIADVQNVIEVAVGGRTLTRTVEGRERYPVRVRYMRELRDDMESLGDVLVADPTGRQIPLRELAEIRYQRGPQVIKSENTFLVGYVLFDKRPGYAEVDVVEHARSAIEAKIASGDLNVPAGVSYEFAGSYENQVRATRRLSIILPVSLVIILLILYLQFRSAMLSLIILIGVFVAGAGGMLMIWLYGQDWFLNFDVFDVSMREVFQIHPVNLSVAVWVGFIALFGIAVDDGVVMATRIRQSFDEMKPTTIEGVRQATLAAGRLRIRACLMTTATTVLALLPVLTSSGRGADIMIPMAIPAFGGMLVELLTLFVVPVLYCGTQEIRIHAASARQAMTSSDGEDQ